MSNLLSIFLVGCSGPYVQRPSFDFIGKRIKAYPSEIVVEDLRKKKVGEDVSLLKMSIPFSDFAVQPEIGGRYKRAINQEIMGVFSTSGREVRVVVRVLEAKTTSDKSMLTGHFETKARIGLKFFLKKDNEYLTECEGRYEFSARLSNFTRESKVKAILEKAVGFATRDCIDNSHLQMNWSTKLENEI